MALALLSESDFQSLLLLPTIKLGPSGADSWVGGLVYILGPCGSLQPTLLWGWEFLPLPQPSGFFRGFEAWFPCTRTLSCSVCLMPQLFSRFICTWMWDLPVCQLLPCCESSLPWLPISPSSTSLDECFFFNSLVVGPPYSSIFQQFWLVFVFKFVVVLLLVVQGGTACLPIPPSWPEVPKIIYK